MSRSTYSIVIPTYNRPAELRQCLTAISRLEYPRELFEIIVVDDESQISPENIAAEFETQIDLRLIRQPHAGPATARNAGAAAAKYEYVVFTDDDCAPLPDWLQKLDDRFVVSAGHGIGGKVINYLEDNPYSNASQLLVDYLYSYYNGTESGTARFFTSNNLAFPVKEFLEVGGFDTTFPRAAGEDRELCMRWLKSGHLLTYEPDAKVAHHHQLSLKKFWRQHFYYGCGAYRFHQILASRRQSPIQVEPLSFYWRLLRHPVHNGISNSTGLTVLLAISQLANAAGFFWEKLHYKGNHQFGKYLDSQH